MISTCTGEWERSLGEWSGGYRDGLAIGDDRVASEGLMGTGYCQMSLGRPEEAVRSLEEAIRRSAGGVCDFIHGISHAFLGIVLYSIGRADEGVAAIEESIRLHARDDDHEARGVALSFLAQTAFGKGEHARALDIYREALVHLEAVGDLPEVARVHSEMGWTALAGGDVARARRSFQSAVRTNEVVGSPRGTGLALLGLAAVEAAEGRTERAVSVAAVAEALSRRAGVVIAHPMAPGLADRITALRASIPKLDLDGLVANASTLTPAAVLAMVGE